MKRNYCSMAFLGGLLVILTLSGCQTVPETGRRQLVLIPESQEMQLGLTSFDQMKKDVPVSKDPAANALVQKVGRRIAAVAPLPNAQWEFVVFESKEANAFCLPGGKVGVYTGLLPIAQNEAGLATVLGHEVSHAVAHHGAERMSEALVLQGLEPVATKAAGAALGGDAKYQAAVNSAYGVVSQVGVELPHSRKQEAEADYMGLLYMARAGYNPQEAVNFWQRFKAVNDKAGQSGPFDRFLRTHPLDAARIQALQAEMPKAMQEYQKSSQNPISK